MPDLNTIIMFMLIFLFFIPIATSAIGMFLEQAEDRRVEPCKQHTWSNNSLGHYVCLICKKSPLEDIAQPGDHEMPE